MFKAIADSFRARSTDAHDISFEELEKYRLREAEMEKN